MAAWYGTYPNLFEIIGNSIPELLDRIPALNNVHRFGQVREALRVTSLVYKTQMSNNFVRISWDDPVFQCAYVFLYFVKHSHLVYETLHNNSHHFESIWRQLREIKVCSIGGGPGSDIAGVIAFLEETTFGVSLRCSILDIFPQWQNAWYAVARNMTSRLNPVHVSYHRLNLVETASFTADCLQRISNANLVTFVKSFSTVSRNQTVRYQILPHIMNVIKPGGFVLFIDNSAAPDQNEIFKQIAQERGFRMLHESISETALSLCSSTNMEAFSKAFDYRPMRNCSVTVYLMQKPLLCPLTLLGQIIPHHIPQNANAQNVMLNFAPTFLNVLPNVMPPSQNTLASDVPASQNAQCNMILPHIAILNGEFQPHLERNCLNSDPRSTESLKSKTEELISIESVISKEVLEIIDEEECEIARSRSSSLSSSCSTSSSSANSYIVTEDNLYILPAWENFGIAIISVFVVLVIFF